MHWIFFALLTPLFWGITNIIDKVIIDKYIKSPFILTAIVQFFALFWVVLFSFFIPMQIPSINTLALYSFSVAVWMGGIIFYYKAINEGEASKVITAFNMLPIFVLVMAGLFLGESITGTQIFGVLLLVAGAVLVSVKKTQGRYFNRWILFVVFSGILFSSDMVFSKIVIDEIGWFSALYWKMVISAVFLIVLLPLYYKKLFTTFKKNPKATLIAGLGEGTSLFARGSLYFAFTLAPVSLIYAFSSLQPFFVLIMAIAFTKILPKYLKEEINADSIFLKLLAVILAVAGAALISL